MLLVLPLLLVGFLLSTLILKDDTGNIPLILNRVSTSTQLDALPVQSKENVKRVKDYGFNKKAVSIIQQESGKKQQRQSLDDAFAVVKNNPKKKYTLFVRDISRLGRKVPVMRETIEAFNKLGVNVFIMDSNLHMTGDPNDYNDLMIFTILAAVAEGGKGGETAASKVATQAAREKGIFSGGIKEAYTLKVAKTGKRKGKSIFRLIYDDIPNFNNGTGLSGREFSRQLNMSPSMVRVIRKQLIAIEERGGKAKLDEYLNFWDTLIAAEKRKGVGVRTRPKSQGGMTARANALHRVTVAYIQDPFGWPDPATVGNPDTALPTAPPEATGTIQDALDNYTWYYKKRQ